MKRIFATIFVLVVCALAAFLVGHNGAPTPAPVANSGFPMVNMQRLSKIQGQPLYNGVSYKEDYSKLPPIAERHKLYDRARLPANSKPDTK